jgi:hypothetical protein
MPYLSDGFLDAVRFANDKARELGLRVDITLGSGWPYGGPKTPVELASARLRYERGTDAPKLLDGEKVIGTVDGITFIASRTRQQVKRPAAGAEGWVLDHYNPTAIENHLTKVGDKLMTAFGAHPPTAVFSDSLEVYGADWTDDFLQQFQKRRGYDLKPYLPALVQDIGPKTGAIRHDWGLTLSELADERYLTPVRQWAAAHHTLFRSQTYGIPPVTLSSNALVDLPEGEEGGGAEWKHFTPTRWAASASHLYRRPLTSSETFTWLHSPVFRATPLDMKAEADLHFLQGINQLVCHGWPYSPPQAGEPGWHFYAAAVFNNHNPWWIVMPDITAYLQRVSFLLRQGQPANDVALYLPTHDAFASFQLNPNPRSESRASVNQAMDRLIGRNVIPQILESGYNFDYIDDSAIAKVGIPYPVLVLPNVDRIPLATMQKISEYAKNGGIVVAVGRVPAQAPGLMDENDTPKIQELAKGVRVVEDTKLGETLHGLYAPDMETAPEINFIHRKLPYADIYFVANTSNHPVRFAPKFRAKQPEIWPWDPLTGSIRLSPASLAPYESLVVVLANTGVGADNRPHHAEPIDLSSGWTVTLTGKPSMIMGKLEPWPDKFFSGTATYEKTVRIGTTASWRLNFGEGTPIARPGGRSNGFAALLDPPVREAAVVYVNGKKAGSVWCPPYEVNVDQLLHVGDNQIRIVVANLAVNQMANQPLPDYHALIAKYGERFQDQDMDKIQPLPSGLLGPIKLVAK